MRLDRLPFLNDSEYLSRVLCCAADLSPTCGGLIANATGAALSLNPCFEDTVFPLLLLSLTSVVVATSARLLCRRHNHRGGADAAHLQVGDERRPAPQPCRSSLVTPLALLVFGSSAALLRYWPASHVFSAHTEPSAASEYLPAPQGAQATSVVAVPSVVPCPAGHDGALCGPHGAPPSLVSEYCDPTHASHFASSASAEPGLRPEPAAHDVTVWAAHAQSEQPARLGCAAYRPGAQLTQDASSRNEDPSTYTVPAAHPLTDLSSQRERRGAPGEGQAHRRTDARGPFT